MMQQSIEDSSCHHGIAEHRSPFSDTAVGGDEHCTPLVAPGHELEEQMGRVGVERKIAKLVDDKQLGLGKKSEPLFQASLAMGSHERRNQCLRRCEQHRVVLADDLPSKRDREMGLPDARRTEQQQCMAKRL